MLKKQPGRFLSLFGCLLMITQACHSTSDNPQYGAVYEDFSLGAPEDKKDQQLDQYYSDLERSTGAIAFRSSFPLSFSVANTMSDFSMIPAKAQSPLPSRLTIRLGQCRLFLKTGPVQVVRYLYTGNWVKFGEPLQAERTVKLEARTDLNLKMASQLKIEIPKRHLRDCWKLLYGRRTFLGRYQLHQSVIGLIPDPSSPRKKIKKVPTQRRGTKVYVYWHKDWKHPVLRNDLEFPAVVESPYYRTLLGKRGFYYIHFQPVLRMQNVDRLVINIPLSAEQKKIDHRESPARQK